MAPPRQTPPLLAHTFATEALLPLVYSDLATNGAYLTYRLRVNRPQSLKPAQQTLWRSLLDRKIRTEGAFRTAFAATFRRDRDRPRAMRGRTAVERRTFIDTLFLYYRLFQSRHLEVRFDATTGLGLYARKAISLELGRTHLGVVVGQHVRMSRTQHAWDAFAAQRTFTDVRQNDRRQWSRVVGPLAYANHACDKHYNVATHLQARTERARQQTDWQRVDPVRALAAGEELLVCYGDDYDLPCAACSEGDKQP